MSRTFWGVDIGATGTRIAQVTVEGRRAVMERLLKIPPEADLAAALADSGLVVGDATLGLGGRDVMLRLLRVQEAPLPRLKMIMDFELAQINAKSQEPLSGAYHICRSFAGSGGDLLALVALVKDQTAETRIEHLRAAGCRVYRMLPGAVAVFNTFLALKRYEPSGTYLLVDVGAESTDVVLVRDLELVAARTMSIGGALFTQSLADALGISPADAEGLKRQRGVIKPKNWDSEREKEISDGLTGAAERLCAGLQGAVMFMRRQLRVKELNFDKVLLFGGGAALPGLADHVGRFMRTEAEVAVIVPPPEDACAELDARPALAEKIPSRDASGVGPGGGEFATAVGLALAGAGAPFVQLDLVPRSLKKKIFFRERTVYLMAAGVFLLLFLILMGVAVGRERGSALQRREQLEERKSELEQRRSLMAKMRKDLALAEEALLHIGNLSTSNRHLVLLLCRLCDSRLTPRGVRLTSLEHRYRPATLVEKDGALEWSIDDQQVVLSGEIVTQEGAEMEILQGFRKRLGRLDFVRKAEIDAGATRRERGRFVFRMVLTLEKKREAEG